MDNKQQHAVNAAKEKHWLDDARRDYQNLEEEGHKLIRQGKTIEGNFDLQEARNAVSWITKRQQLLRREEKLAGK